MTPGFAGAGKPQIMNIIAIDIGNTNITIGLSLDDQEQFIKSISGNEHY